MSRGFDKEAINSQLLFGLTLEERTGLVVYDRAKPHHTCTLHGATIAWGSLASGIPYIDLTKATPDWVDCPAAGTADLDFTAGDFSLAVWVKPDSIANYPILFMRGLFNTDGWCLYLSNDGEIILDTYQAGATQEIGGATHSVTVGNWSLIGLTRSGILAWIYFNGIDITDFTWGVIANPLTSARELHIGVKDDEGIESAYDGKLALPRIWGRKLSAEEMHEIWNRERVLFAV